MNTKTHPKLNIKQPMAGTPNLRQELNNENVMKAVDKGLKYLRGK